MRFFAHDGKSTHGPAGIEELLKLPGFDGDTLVCPVGSNDTADWKPALAYPPFKKALLEAVSAPAPVEPPKPAFLPPMPAIVPMAPAPVESAMPVPAPFPLPLPAAPASVATPAPAPAPKTVPCPRCAHANLEDARYCNKCGARMDGKAEDISVPAAVAPPPVLPSAPVLPPAPIAAPAPLPSNDPFMPTSFPSSLPSAAAPEPAYDAFAHLDPMRSFPADPPPMAAVEPAKRPLQPGKMGQLGAYEEAPTSSLSSITPELPSEPVPAAASAVPLWKRPPVLAGLAGAVLVAAGLGYMAMNKKAPVETVAELTPSAPAPMPAPATEATPPSQPAAPLYSTPAQTSSPSIPLPRAPKATAKAKKKVPTLNERTLTPPAVAAVKPKTKRARKPRPVPAPKPEPTVESDFADSSGAGDTMIESRAPDTKPAPKGKRAAKAAKAAASQKDPLLEALLTDATQPSAESAAEPAADAAAEAPLAKPGEKALPQIGQRAAPAAKSEPFSLPGLSRPVSASDRAASAAARAAKPAAETPLPSPSDVGDAADAAAGLAEPGKSSPPPGIEDEPAKSAEGDQLALVQVHEQFDFCSQLIGQGAYGDHFDTCLCKDAREAAPYRGRRGFYVSAKKKEANGGQLETSAKIVSSKINDGTATIKARWKSGASDKGRESTQLWKLEDGLWCQAQ